jgi:Raf kinase inhibitor-like YbhB/YbcL family protein
MANQSRRVGLSVCAVLALGLCAAASSAQEPFQLRSVEFSNGSTMPLSTIYNNQVNGVNTCTANGAAGYDESPELSWSGAPRGTKSFVVELYDVTASFTHWGMYNIAPDVRRLPENAGAAGSPWGTMVGNDFGLGPQYDGPCPPANYPPNNHKYVFTVYALSTTLDLPQSANFPANAETLDHALIRAGERGEILGKAKLVGFYSSTPDGTPVP